MTSIDLTLGSLLIGTFINLILYIIEAVCVYIYFHTRRSQNDSKVVKYAVPVAFMSDTLGTMGTLTTSYLLSINYSRRDLSILAPIWPLSVWSYSNALSALLVRTFMCRRLWILSRRIVLCAVTVVIIVAAFIFSILTDIMTLAKQRNLATRHEDLYIAVSSLTLGCIVDMMISLGLLWQLRPSRVMSNDAKRLVRRTSFVIIPSGSIPCVMGLAELIGFVSRPDTRVSTGIGFVSGRIYTLTMLFTLIYRDKIAAMSEYTTSRLPMHISIVLQTSTVTHSDPPSPLTPPPHLHTK